MSLFFVDPTTSSRPLRTADWNYVQQSGLHQLIQPDQLQQFFIRCECDPNLNPNVNILDCINLAESYAVDVLGEMPSPMQIGEEEEEVVFQSPRTLSTGGTSHITLFDSCVVRNSADRKCIMNKLLMVLEAGLLSGKTKTLRVLRNTNGLVREEWFIQFDDPLALPLPSGEDAHIPQDLVHRMPPEYQRRISQPLQEWSKCKNILPNTYHPSPLKPKNRQTVLDMLSGIVDDALVGVAPMYRKDQLNKLLPERVRITLDTTVCHEQMEHHKRCSFIDITAQGTAYIYCEECCTNKDKSLSTKDPHVFEFLQFFWSKSCWMKVLNASIFQTPDGTILQRMVDDQNRAVHKTRTIAAFTSFMAGKKYVAQKKKQDNKKKKKKKGEEEEEEEEQEEEKEWCFYDIFPEWLKCPYRSQCQDVTFDPQKPPGLINGEFLNKYEGFGIKPQAPASGKLEDAAPVFRNHIKNVICGNDQATFDFLETVLAQLVQYPHKKMGILIVLLGKEGTGKNTFVDVIRKFFGQHGIELSTARHMTGNFNGHLENQIFIVLNEAVWGGDKTMEGILKTAITEDVYMQEAKGKDAKFAANYFNIFILSNEKWCAPVHATARRYFVPPVSEVQENAEEYFTKLHSAIKSGEDRQYFWYLQNYKCPNPIEWRPEHHMPPRTAGFVEQIFQDRSQALLKFVCQTLQQDGEWIYQPKFGNSVPIPIIQKGKPTKVHRNNILKAFKEAADEDPALKALVTTQHALTKFLTATLGEHFNANARLLAHEMVPDVDNDKVYEFQSAEAIIKHLGEIVLKAPAYFAPLSPAAKRAHN